MGCDSQPVRSARPCKNQNSVNNDGDDCRNGDIDGDGDGDDDGDEDDDDDGDGDAMQVEPFEGASGS